MIKINADTSGTMTEFEIAILAVELSIPYDELKRILGYCTTIDEEIKDMVYECKAPPPEYDYREYKPINKRSAPRVIRRIAPRAWSGKNFKKVS